MTETLLSIDPGGVGGHTGIGLFKFDDSTPVTLVDSWAVPDQLDGFREWVSRDAEMYEDFTYADHVVCEKFVNRNIPGADLSPLLIEGVVRYLRPDVVLQPAASKNTIVPDAILKKMGLWFERSGDHHADRREAARHALIYMRNIKHRPTLEAMYGTGN